MSDDREKLAADVLRSLFPDHDGARVAAAAPAMAALVDATLKARVHDPADEAPRPDLLITMGHFDILRGMFQGTMEALASVVEVDIAEGKRDARAIARRMTILLAGQRQADGFDNKSRQTAATCIRDMALGFLRPKGPNL